MSSFQNVTTESLEAFIPMLESIMNSEDLDNLLSRSQAELEKRKRMVGQNQTKDEKWSRIEEMPYGPHKGRKINGVPVSYLQEELKHLEEYHQAGHTKLVVHEDGVRSEHEVQPLISTFMSTIKWKMNKEPISVMPFGKHKGTKINDMPSGYIEWLLDNSSKPGQKPLDEDLESALRNALAMAK